MRAATHLARLAGVLGERDGRRIFEAIAALGALPPLDHVRAGNLVARLGSDKKTVHGKVHFVLPEAIGKVRIVSGLAPELIREAAETALADLVAVA